MLTGNEGAADTVAENVSQNDEICIRPTNEELCIKNDELCIKNEEL